MTVLKLTGKLNFPSPQYALAQSVLNFEEDTNLSKFKFYSIITKHDFLVSKKSTLSVCLFLSFFYIKVSSILGHQKHRKVI